MPRARENSELRRIWERLSRGRAAWFSRFLSIAGFGGGLQRLPSSAETRRVDGFGIGNTQELQQV